MRSRLGNDDATSAPLRSRLGNDDATSAPLRSRLGNATPSAPLRSRLGNALPPLPCGRGSVTAVTEGFGRVSTRQAVGEPAKWYRHRLAECGVPAAGGWLGRLSDRIWERACAAEQVQPGASRARSVGAGNWRSADAAGGELMVVRVTLPAMDKRAWAVARESLGEAEIVETAEGHLEVRRVRVEERRQPRARGNRSVRDSYGRLPGQHRMSRDSTPSKMGSQGVRSVGENWNARDDAAREAGKPGDGPLRECGLSRDGRLKDGGVSPVATCCESEAACAGVPHDGEAASGRAWDGLRAALERTLGASMGRRSEAPRDDVARLECEQRVPRGEIRTLWTRLCAAYGLALGEAGATLTLSGPLAWAEEWAQVPTPRDARYFERFHSLSLALQEMGRHWLPAITLGGTGSFEDIPSAQAMLVYAASEPSAERRTASYGYEAMSPRAVERCALTAAKRLPALLEGVHAELRAAGAAELAEEYAPERARLIIGLVARQHKALAALLAADAFHLEQCFHLVDAARETAAWEPRNPARAMRKLMQAAERMAAARQRAGRRLAGGAGLGEVYLIEATRVLANGERPGAFEARLVVERERVRGAMAA